MALKKVKNHEYTKLVLGEGFRANSAAATASGVRGLRGHKGN